MVPLLILNISNSTLLTKVLLLLPHLSLTKVLLLLPHLSLTKVLLLLPYLSLTKVLLLGLTTVSPNDSHHALFLMHVAFVTNF